jgi:hypothetical protein
MWRSLVARGVWDAEVAGSNPAIPTRNEYVKAVGQACCHAGGSGW